MTSRRLPLMRKCSAGRWTRMKWPLTNCPRASGSLPLTPSSWKTCWGRGWPSKPSCMCVGMTGSVLHCRWSSGGDHRFEDPVTGAVHSFDSSCLPIMWMELACYVTDQFLSCCILSVGSWRVKDPVAEQGFLFVLFYIEMELCYVTDTLAFSASVFYVCWKTNCMDMHERDCGFQSPLNDGSI